jgi:hypothetical protein
MAWTTPETAVAGEVLTAAWLNQNVRDNLNAVGLIHITTVSFTTESALQINDCFSASYENYLLLMNQVGSTTAQSVNAQWSVGGTPNSTASSYVTQRLDAINTSVTAARQATTAWQIARTVNTLRSWVVAQISGPFIARPTVAWSTVAGGDNVGQQFFATHNQSTSYDGINIAPSTGTFTGSISIYGYTA